MYDARAVAMRRGRIRKWERGKVACIMFRTNREHRTFVKRLFLPQTSILDSSKTAGNIRRHLAVSLAKYLIRKSFSRPGSLQVPF
jgi:hypothetical protein